MSLRRYGLTSNLHKTLMNYNVSALTRTGSDTLIVTRYFLFKVLYVEFYTCQSLIL